MWNRFRRWIALAGAVLALGALSSDDASARGGGGRGGGRGGPGGGRGGGRGGATRGALRGMGRGAGRAGGKSGASGKSAKDWELLRDQEARLQMIKERRERLMDLDRKKEQEAWLADKRLKAADAAARTDDIH